MGSWRARRGIRRPVGRALADAPRARRDGFRARFLGWLWHPPRQINAVLCVCRGDDIVGVIVGYMSAYL